MHVSASLIFAVVSIHGQKQTFIPNPMHLSISENHIIAVLAADQESANAVIAQMSLIISTLHESPDPTAALAAIKTAEGPGSIICALDPQRAADFAGAAAQCNRVHSRNASHVTQVSWQTCRRA